MKVSHLAPHSSSQYGVDFIKSTHKFDIQPMSYRHMPEGLYRVGHEKVARFPFCTRLSYRINFCIYAMLQTRATFSWPHEKVAWVRSIA